MDYTEISNTIKEVMKAQGTDEKYIDREETLYYDESGNVKHLIVKDGKLNAETDTVFVLGGVEAESILSMEDLKSYLGKSPETELKSTQDLKGNFVEILRKDNMRQILLLIRDCGWYVHFQAIQVLYYGFVDIVDSIDGTQVDPMSFKAELYKVLKKDPDKTLSTFKNYKYPNIKPDQIEPFLSEILLMINEEIADDAKKFRINPILLALRSLFVKAKSQKELAFIQGETTHEWVGEFVQFYRQEILSFPNKTLVFDEEKQVMKILESEEIEINGKKANNYSFKESGSDSMIQVSDYVVSILRKYIVFLDRLESEVEADINKFDEIQMINFRLLNMVLADSLNYNPVFVHFTASTHTIAKFFKYMKMYGGTMANG